MDIVLVTIILIAAIALLAGEKLPVDLTAIGIMVALMVTGVLTPRQAVAGFANPAPLTVGALFVVSKALTRTGSLGLLNRLIVHSTGGRPRRILALALLLAGLLSAFVNNTPVVVLLLSVLLAVSGRFGLSPAQFLIPVSFISILAGTTTLIGTSTNIIISDLAVGAGLAPLGMFELARLGVPLALIGGLLLMLLSRRLLPQTHTPIYHHGQDERTRYISELQVTEESALIGQDVAEALGGRSEDIEIFEVVRGDLVLYPETDDCTLEADDLVLVGATATDLVDLIGGKDVTLPTVDGEPLENPYDRNAQIVEVVIAPESRMIGRRLRNTPLAAWDNLHVIGMQRRRTHYSERQLSRLRLDVGDILLIQCGTRQLARLRAETGLVVAEDVVRTLENRRKGPLAGVIFGAMVAAAALGWLDILTAALSAAFLMLLSGCLKPREAYDALDLPVLILIVGTLALGDALARTGAADLYASGLVAATATAGPHAVLAGVIVMTSVLSHFLSNNSTAVLMAPIALATAASLGVDPRPFVVGVCFGASACFATPIGYQTNLLVYGPGGYRFGDFTRLGMVLNVLVWFGASIFVPRLWPF
ncbi:SLC13 family permease [bacterium]|nr:SLC13 family permease [bacterium]